MLRARSRSADWFQDRSRRPHRSPKRTREPIEGLVVDIRRELNAQDLFCGAQNILWELERRGHKDLLSLRTVNRILGRHRLVDHGSEPYQSKGKTYPKLSGSVPNQAHESDFLGPCYLTGPTRFYSVNSVDIATGRCGLEPVFARDAQSVIDAFWRIWGRLGIPNHQQIDNEMVFYGSPTHPRGMGCLIRLCLMVGVEPWFIPMGEPWRNGVVEKFNHHYRQKFLSRVPLHGPKDLQKESRLFEKRHNGSYRYSKLGGRTPRETLMLSNVSLKFPESVKAPVHPLPKPEKGKYHLVRFIRSNGLLDIFGERFRVPKQAMYEYLTATINVRNQSILLTVHGTVIDQIPYKLR